MTVDGSSGITRGTETVTLASIVEREAVIRSEQPVIASVFLNRLKAGLPLQADPTVGYALGRGPRSRLTFRDLRVESPYNTYRHVGLPPGPICNPGKDSIAAVLDPQVSDDLFFVATGRGGHVFAATISQQACNVAAYRAFERQKQDPGATPHR